MAIKYMYITNQPEVARIAETAGVDRIFVDMEQLGKAQRQCGMNSVQSNHTVEDVEALRPVVKKAELMVRVNPMHEATGEYCSSREEIENVIAAGADVIMLPYFKTVDEVDRFLEYVDGRAITFPLLETPEAVACLDEILRLQGIDEIHIGLNDLSLGYGMPFLFQPLADGTVDRICDKLRAAGMTYGIGGIASPGKGVIPAEYIMGEYCRLGSSNVILSRSFCNIFEISDLEEIRKIFTSGVRSLRKLEQECGSYTAAQFAKNHAEVTRRVQMVIDNRKSWGSVI